MRFSNEIVAGETLVRTAIKSPDYVAGVSGWRIGRDGSAEFNVGTFRGNLAAGSIDIGGADATSFHVDDHGNLWLGDALFAAAPFKVAADGSLVVTGASITADLFRTAASGRRVEMTVLPPFGDAGKVRFWTGEPGEVLAGSIDIVGGGGAGSVEIAGPSFGPGQAVVALSGDGAGTRIHVQADVVEVQGDLRADNDVQVNGRIDGFAGKTWPSLLGTTGGAIGTDEFFFQAGSTVANTAVDGRANIGFPANFPHGCVMVVVCNGDSNTNYKCYANVFGFSDSGFTAEACQQDANPFVGAFRFNWIAIGW